jgi:hypothetical protein
VIPLRVRYALIVTLFIVGGLTIIYIAITFDERIAFLLPAWLVIWFLLILFGVRCPRCKLPATVALARIGRWRIWVPMAAVNDECPSCGADLRRRRARGDISR